MSGWKGRKPVYLKPRIEQVRVENCRLMKCRYIRTERAKTRPMRWARDIPICGMTDGMTVTAGRI